MTQIDRAVILQQVVEGVRTRASAAETMGICERQLRRLLRRFEVGGAAGLVSRSRGKAPINRVDDDVRALILGRFRGEYAGLGPTSLAQVVAEREGIVVSREWVRALMIEHGLWSAQRRSRKRTASVEIQRRSDPAITVGFANLIDRVSRRTPDPKKVRTPAQNHPWKAPFKPQGPSRPDISALH